MHLKQNEYNKQNTEKANIHLWYLSNICDWLLIDSTVSVMKLNIWLMRCDPTICWFHGWHIMRKMRVWTEEYYRTSERKHFQLIYGKRRSMQKTKQWQNIIPLVHRAHNNLNSFRFIWVNNDLHLAYRKNQSLTKRSYMPTRPNDWTGRNEGKSTFCIDSSALCKSLCKCSKMNE